MLRRSLLLMLLGGVALTPVLTRAQSPSGPTEVSGVKFDSQMDLHGTKLLLNGAGTRYKFVVKVYAAGLYAPTKVATPEAAWDHSAPRALKIVMLRDIDANELGKLFTRGMQDNTTREEFGKAIPGTLKLADLFSARKKLVAGDYFIVDYQPGVGTAIVVNGKPEGELIKEPEFFSALMKIWVGKSPADYQLKDALLGLGKR